MRKTIGCAYLIATTIIVTGAESDVHLHLLQYVLLGTLHTVIIEGCVVVVSDEMCDGVSGGQEEIVAESNTTFDAVLLAKVGGEEYGAEVFGQRVEMGGGSGSDLSGVEI